MKSTIKQSLSIVLLLVITSCGTTTNITGSWKKPGATASRFNSIFVSALTSNIPAKSAVADGLENMLKSTLKGYKRYNPKPTILPTSTVS